jgi:cytochrome P450
MTEEGFASQPIRPGLHEVSGYVDARAVLADPRFVHWLRRDEAATPLGAAIARWLDAMDPRRPNPARATVIHALSPAASNALRPGLERRAETLLAALPGGVAFDVERCFARPLTHALVFAVLGVAEAARPGLDPLLEALEVEIPRALFPMADQPYDPGVFVTWESALSAAMAERGLAMALRADLAAMGAPGDFGAFTAMFAFAATGNITRFIAHAAYELAARPALWRRLREEPTELAATLEELLRYDPPLPFVHLIAGEAVAGGAIAAGDSILVSLARANRDPSVYAAPQDLTPGRRAPHLAFGSGPLTCIGAPVARMLARAAISRLVAVAEPAAGDPVQFPFVRLQSCHSPAEGQEGNSADAIT